jgi:hypothetical protein
MVFDQLVLDKSTLVHNQLLLFDIFILHLHVQHDRRRLPANHNVVIDDNQLFLDPTTVVHDQLHDFNFQLHIQHDRRRFPANNDFVDDQLVLLSDLDHEHVLLKRLRPQVC